MASSGRPRRPRHLSPFGPRGQTFSLALVKAKRRVNVDVTSVSPSTGREKRRGCCWWWWWGHSFMFLFEKPRVAPRDTRRTGCVRGIRRRASLSVPVGATLWRVRWAHCTARWRLNAHRWLAWPWRPCIWKLTHTRTHTQTHTHTERSARALTHTHERCAFAVSLQPAGRAVFFVRFLFFSLTLSLYLREKKDNNSWFTCRPPGLLAFCSAHSQPAPEASDQVQLRSYRHLGLLKLSKTR